MHLTKWQQQRYPAFRRKLDGIVARLRDLGVQKVILYGSYARGDFHEDSDVDLFIVWETTERFIDRIERVLEVTGAPIPIEPLVYTREEVEQLRGRDSGFLSDIEREGEVLYEQC